MKDFMKKYALLGFILGCLLALLVAPLFVTAQGTQPHGDCPPGWVKNPEKYPACYGWPLPVTVKSFTGKATPQGTAQLQWQVAQVHGHSYYVIERSPDAKAYTALGQTTGTQYTDTAPPAAAYYRLVAVAIDGTRQVHARPVFVQVQSPGTEYLAYTPDGRYVGTYSKISNVPRDQPLIINGCKRVIQ